MRVRALEDRKQGGFSAWMVAAVALALVAAVLLSSCGADAQGTQDQEPATGSGEETVPAGEEAESAGQAIGVSVADVTDNPSEFYGKEVTLSGLVTEVVGPNAVAIGGDELFGGDPVLIVGAKKLPRIAEGIPEDEPFEVQQQDLVQATGKLQEFNVKEAENEIGYDLDDNLFADWEGEPAVIADSFVLTPQQGNAAQAQQGVDATISTIVDSPQEFYGRTLTLDGAIARVVNPNAFVIVERQTAQGEGLYDDVAALAENGVLVTTSGGTGPNLTENQTVQVTGTLRQFDAAAFEQDLGVGFPENNEVFSAFSDGPAIVASQIQVTQDGKSAGQ